jgi:DHA2 family multidrug resistance protein
MTNKEQSVDATIVTNSPAPAKSAAPQASRPYAAIAAVLFGAVISTLTSRITTFGLADIRGALGIGFDEGSWINTVFTAAQVFVGPISIWAAYLVGPRRVLLAGASVLLVVEALTPLCHSFPIFILLQTLAGLSSGVFVPVTVGFVVKSLPPSLVPFGIAAYAMNLEMSLNISATLEGWYSEHMSWHWIFWQNAVLAVPLILCLLTSLPKESVKQDAPKGDYFGMMVGAGGLSILCVALDQGERLFWFQSFFITVCVFAGVTAVAIFIVYELLAKDSGIAFSYLLKPNVAILVLLVGLFRFTVLNTSFITPIFLASVHNLRPLQIGDTLRWIAIPQIFLAPCIAFLLLHMDARKVIVIGFSTVALAFAFGTQITSAWTEIDFIPFQLLQGLGQTMALTAVIYFFAKHVTMVHALTFGAIVQTTRLFGGQLGTTSIAVTQRIREQTHSNLLGQHVSLFDQETLSRINALAQVVHGSSFSASQEVFSLKLAILDSAIRIQSITLGLADVYRVAAVCAVAGVILALTLRPPPVQ